MDNFTRYSGENQLCESITSLSGCAMDRLSGSTRTAPLSTSQIRPRFIYSVGCGYLKATKGVKMEQIGGGKRGRIVGFSSQSRHRLMLTIAKVKKDAVLPDFVTLTYPDQFPTVERAKRDLKIFLQRLNREFKESGYIWKLEPQERGAPHFHLMVWGVDTRKLYKWVCKNWFDIAGNGDKNALLFLKGELQDSQKCVNKVRSWRGVWSYASKYLGKTFEVAEWGKSWTGRFWGLGQKWNIPFGEEVEVEAMYRDIVQIMRLQRRYARLKHGSGRSSNSLTVFCDADQWVDKLKIGQGLADPDPRGNEVTNP